MAMPPVHPDLPDMRRAARQATILTVLSAAVVLGALGYGAWQINALDTTLAARRATVKQLEDDITAKQSRANELETRLHDLNAAIQLLPRNQVETAIRKSAASIRPRVYIQIANEDQRPLAGKATDALKAAGYDVPGIEYVGARAPKGNQVRFFERSEANSRQVQEVLTVLKGIGVEAHDQYISLPATSTAPRHLEVWFGTGN
ncbi:MAG: hypothetical protein JST11_13645 [Acidobacteria bacterium]|nr:hypothetical protein [Acidobacteriota bacterium]